MCMARDRTAFWELRFTCYTDIIIFIHRFFLLNVSSVPLCSTRELAHLIHMGQLSHLCPSKCKVNSLAFVQNYIKAALDPT